MIRVPIAVTMMTWVAAAALVVTGSAHAQVQGREDYAGTYLCISDAIGGVVYRGPSKGWVGTGFAGVSKIILKVKKGEHLLTKDKRQRISGYRIELGPFGQKATPCAARGNFNVAISDHGFLVCDTMFQHWHSNFKMGRYMSLYHYGYFSPDIDDPLSPSAEVGKCSRID